MNERHQLGQLIETVQKQNDWSDRDLQDRADRLGLEMSKSNFSRIKNAEVKSVKGSFIRDLSQVLGVPQRVVSDAALSSMGVDVERSSARAEDAVARDITMAGHDRRLALALIEAIRQEAGSEDDRQGEAEPGTEARSKEHRSTDSSEDGSTPRRRTPPMKRHYGKAADEDRSADRGTAEGVEGWEESQHLGEESQDHGGHNPA